MRSRTTLNCTPQPIWDLWRGAYHVTSPSWPPAVNARIFGMNSAAKPGTSSNCRSMLGFLALKPSMSCFIAVSIQSETSCFLTMCARIVTIAALPAAGAAALGASVGLAAAGAGAAEVGAAGVDAGPEHAAAIRPAANPRVWPRAERRVRTLLVTLSPLSCQRYEPSVAVDTQALHYRRL